jgi:hypothetical protein
MDMPRLKFEWDYVFYAIGLFLLFIMVRWFLTIIRKKTVNELNKILYVEANFSLYQALLSNKRLKWIFRGQTIEIMRLTGFLLEGNQERILKWIDQLDHMKLEPYEQFEYLQKRFSYFVDQKNKAEAQQSLSALKNLLTKKNHSFAKAIIHEAELVYDIYIMKKTDLIPSLIEQANRLDDRIMKGITQYRIAKLSYFKQDFKQVSNYLNEAKDNVKGTYWYPIICEAQKNHEILANK